MAKKTEQKMAVALPIVIDGPPLDLSGGKRWRLGYRGLDKAVMETTSCRDVLDIYHIIISPATRPLPHGHHCAFAGRCTENESSSEELCKRCICSKDQDLRPREETLFGEFYTEMLWADRRLAMGFGLASVPLRFELEDVGRRNLAN